MTQQSGPAKFDAAVPLVIPAPIPLMHDIERMLKTGDLAGALLYAPLLVKSIVYHNRDKFHHPLPPPDEW